MKSKTRKTITAVGWLLLVLTLLSIGTEVYGAAVVRDSKVDTWTEFIVEWVPWELSLAVYGALAIWVPVHFYVNYREKKKREEELEELKTRFTESLHKRPTWLEPRPTDTMVDSAEIEAIRYWREEGYHG